jgi:uncharacterized membrane protein YecN with MAPEG domain
MFSINDTAGHFGNYKRHRVGINHSENTSELFAAVQNYGNAIKYIENPSEAVQLAAVHHKISNI